MKIELEVSTTERKIEQVDVPFPVYYSMSDSTESGSWVLVSRIDQTGRTIGITTRENWHGDIEIECEVSKINLKRELHGYLKKGGLSSPATAKQFDDAMEAFLAALK